MAKKKSKDSNVEPATQKDKKDQSPKVYQKNKIDYKLNIAHRDDLTYKQTGLLELIADKNTNVVFVNGPAGTSKTYIAVLAALVALNDKKQSDIFYIRSAVESASRSLGHLPGTLDDKMSVYLAPLVDKLEELLPKSEVQALLKDERVQGLAVNYVRGSSWNAKFIIVDESQNLTPLEMKTIITRFGRFSKLIFIGDSSQTDMKEKSGFMPFFDLFNDDSSRQRGIHCFSFTKEDIVRSKILGFILDKIENTYTPGT